MRVLGIVTARGGSKGIPGKNIIPVAGKPLLAWTADAALASNRVDRVVLSTDDQGIADVGRECGLEVPFMRPPELARDDTPTIPVLQDVVHRLAEDGDHFDAVFTFQPTNPLRTVGDIDGSVQRMEESGCDSVISFSPVGDAHPARMKMIDRNSLRVIDPDFAEAYEGQPRQQLPELWLRNGSVYLTRTPVLMQHNSLKGDDCRAWIIPEERAVNIDTRLDLFIVDQLLRHGGHIPDLAEPTRGTR